MFQKKLITAFKLIIITYVFVIHAHAQTQINDKGFLQLNHQPQQEKMFAHTDKDFYLAGEILWFKLYNVSADSLKLLNISKVAYVEILNANQKPLLQASVALKNGTGDGSFYLTSSLASGNYIFRAYTNWMKNFGADIFFQKQITIVNTLTPVLKTDDNDSDKYDIGFYPEGGNLIAGTPNKVGFKILNKYGFGVSSNGYIVDENNQHIISFSTLKFGMGSFYFTPLQNHTYTAIINISDANHSAEKTIRKLLPAVENDGYALDISGDAQLLHFTISSSNNSHKKIYIVAYNKNHLQTAIEQTLDNNGNATGTIERNKLSAGITHIVLFDDDKLPVSERLIFIKPQPIQITMYADNNSYAIRSEVKINVTSANNANLSLSVFKTDSLQTISDENIISSLYFSSELKGNIESPQYYFTNNDAQSDSALENLLLTQGWSKFRNTKYSKPSFTFAPEFEGQIIKGKVTGKSSGLPAKNIRVFASAPGLHYSFATAISNDSGYVFFDMKDYYGSGELVIQTAGEDSNYKVEIANPFFEQAGNMKPSILYLNEDKLQQLSRYNLYMQVQNAYTLNQLNTFNAPPVDTGAFYGKPDATYLLDNYTRFNTMEEVLREYIANVDVRIKQGNYSLMIADAKHRIFFKNNPLVLVDGVPVFDMNKLMTYNPLKIKKAEVVSEKYYFNSLTADGILSYSTYKGDLDGFNFDAGETELAYDGLQIERKFYSPKYITAIQQQSRLPDYRNVLYWKPQINVTGTAQLSFYTSDVKGKYMAVIQGIGENGNPYYNTATFEVK